MLAAGGALAPASVAVPNDFLDVDIKNNTGGIWTTNTLMTAHGWDPMYFLSEAYKTEVSSEWKVAATGTYVNMTNAAAGTTGGLAYAGFGRYWPWAVANGYTTATVDFSALYDGVRGLFWCWWQNDDPSDSAYLDIANRPTIGSTNFGGISIRADRNASSYWGIVAHDGNGNSTTQNTNLGTGIWAACQFEFIKAQHIKLHVVNAGSEGGMVEPAWPVPTSGQYKTISLTGSGYNAMVPIMPLVSAGSSLDQTIARLCRVSLEYRRIGNDWEHFVDA